MKKFTKILSLALAIVMVTALFAACAEFGYPESPSTSSDPSDTNDPSGTNDPGRPNVPTDTNPVDGRYTIRFKNWDGTVLQSMSVLPGQTPVYTEETPTRESDLKYDYIFEGWNSEIKEATGHFDYIAEFSAVERIIPWDGSVASGFDGGNGSKDNPYRISNGSQLAYLAQLVNEGDALYNNEHMYYKLTDNINLGNLEWNPIGCGYNISGVDDNQYSFNANFDGNDFKIINLSISSRYRTYYTRFGLFGAVKGRLDSVVIQNINIKIGANCVGAMCGELQDGGIIYDCHVSSGSVDGNTHCGGMVGKTESASIASSTVNLSVEGSEYVGGMIGYSLKSSVKSSKVEGNVKLWTTKPKAFAGGLIGHSSWDEEVSYSSSAAKVTFEYNVERSSSATGYAGGFIGTAQGVKKISCCWASGDVYVSGSSNNFMATHDAYAGGFIGYIKDSDSDDIIQNCYTISNVSCRPSDEMDETYLGGFIGYKESTVRVDKCYAAGDLSSSTAVFGYIGGFCGGYASYTTNCVAFGNITATKMPGGYNIGGFVNGSGEVKYRNFDNCFRAEYQRIVVGEGAYSPLASGVLARDLNSESFYRNTLNWGDEWDFSELDVENGKFPTLFE